MEKSEISSEKKLCRSNSHKCKGKSTKLHKKKRKKVSRSSSSSSISSNSSVDSSSSDSNNSHHGVERGTSKYHKKKLKKVKKSIKKKEKKKMKSKLKEIKKSLKHKPSTSKNVQNTDSNNHSELSDKAKAMAPMTKEEWEKRQSIIRRVYDQETGRYRLIKGDGEILEEIVSRERHKEINQKATKGDGEYFQSQLKLNTSFK